MRVIPLLGNYKILYKFLHKIVWNLRESEQMMVYLPNDTLSKDQLDKGMWADFKCEL